MRRAALVALASVCVAGAARADFVPSGPEAAQRLLGKDAFDDVDRSEVARAVERQGFWAGEPIGVAQCAGCHADVAAQWAGSAHRYASFDNPYYAASVEAFRAERGAHQSRFCAGCHDPAMVASGRIDAAQLDHRTREAQAGIVCLACHSMDDHPTRRGNGEFTARLDPWPAHGGKQHDARLRSAAMATSEFCSRCHRVGLTEEVTGGRWLRGQDDWFAWRGSSVSGRGAAAIHRAPAAQRCQDCHMPLVPATLGDAAARRGADGVPRVRSHRFLGANTALPHLRGDAAAEAEVAAFLRDRVSLDLSFGGDATRRDVDTVDAVLRSRGVGHRFPGGTMDSNEVWIEVRALDREGRVLAESGVLRPRAAGAPALDKEAHLVRAQMVDGDGVPLRLRDVQHARGVVDDNALAPGDPQAVRYALPKATARVEARLLYRKFTAEYAAYACKDVADPVVRARCAAPPIVELARATLAVPATLAPVAERCLAEPWERVLDHGLALAGGLADQAEEARAWLRCAEERAPRRVEPVLGLMRLALVLGQTDEVVALARRAAVLDPAHPATRYLTTLALLRAYRARPARREAERLLRRLPDDPAALALLARARGLDRDPRGALRAADALLAIDPESEEGLYQRALALRDLRRPREAERAEAAYLRHRVATEDNLALRAGFRREEGQLHDECQPLHTHALVTRVDPATRAARR